MATIPCATCGCHEHAELLDTTKPSGKLECIACAGPGWRPMNHASISKSVCDHLKHHYEAWTWDDIERLIGRHLETQDALASATTSHPHPASLCA